MPKMKQSYKEIGSTFVETDYGKIRLELAVGQARVLVKDNQGIKATLDRQDVRESNHPLIAACRDSDEKRFNSFCAELDKLDG